MGKRRRLTFIIHQKLKLLFAGVFITEENNAVETGCKKLFYEN